MARKGKKKAETIPALNQGPEYVTRVSKRPKDGIKVASVDSKAKLTVEDCGTVVSIVENPVTGARREQRVSKRGRDNIIVYRGDVIAV